MDNSNGFSALVKDAKSRIKEVEIDEFFSLIETNPNIRIVDVREESEWAKGHIPNAIHLSKGLIEVKIEKVIPDKEDTIVLYCGGGSRSALAADNIQKMGYKNVISLNGGYGAWGKSR